MSRRIDVGGRAVEVEVQREGAGLRIRVGGRTVDVKLARGPAGFARAELDGRPVEFGWARRAGGYWITLGATTLAVGLPDERKSLAERAERAHPSSEVTVRAPLPGLVRAVSAVPGRRVRRGAALVTLDAMKMENEIQSPADAVVIALHVRVGAAVEKDAELVTLRLRS